MKKNEMIPPEEQIEYILLENTCKRYEVLDNWKVGIILKRVSIWYPGNGCGVRQAYFVSADKSNSHMAIAWQDHVKEIIGQLELEF
jgi:hypothetical protein